MARLEEVAARISALRELRQVIRAMRAISAVQMQQAQRSLEAISDYSVVVGNALSESASMLGAEPSPGSATDIQPRGIIAFGSEHGFCGAFNNRLVTVLASVLDAHGAGHVTLILVGSRFAQRAEERRISAATVLPMATHTTGVSAVARSVGQEVYRMLQAQGVTRLEAIHAIPADGRQIEVQRVRLLPLDPEIFATPAPAIPPVTNLTPTRLFDVVAIEYLFAMLERCTMESFAAENTARFHAMDAARENIEKKSRDLVRVAQQVRQETVTTELLDLIAGITAITEE